MVTQANTQKERQTMQAVQVDTVAKTITTGEMVTEEQAVKMLLGAGANIIKVTFKKRTDWSVRTMIGRLGRHVHKGKTGEGKKFEDWKMSLITVCEFVSDRDEKGRFSKTSGMQFRHCTYEGILSIRMGGKNYQVVR